MFTAFINLPPIGIFFYYCRFYNFIVGFFYKKYGNTPFKQRPYKVENTYVVNCSDWYMIHLYCLAVQADFNSDEVECLPVT